MPRGRPWRSLFHARYFPKLADWPLWVGSFFSGYGGHDLVAKTVLDAETARCSEISELVSRFFSHHRGEAANLGDITIHGNASPARADLTWAHATHVK